MRIHKANYLHLYKAGLALAPSDRQEMDRLEAGRDPIDVLTASSNDPTIRAITDHRASVLAVGGHSGGIIWFVHTEHAEALNGIDRRRLLMLLYEHLIRIKVEAMQEQPEIAYHFTNIVSAANRKHLKLLERLGAVFDKRPRIHNGFEFRQFYF